MRACDFSRIMIIFLECGRDAIRVFGNSSRTLENQYFKKKKKKGTKKKGNSLSIIYIYIYKCKCILLYINIINIINTSVSCVTSEKKNQYVSSGDFLPGRNGRVGREKGVKIQGAAKTCIPRDGN